MSKKTYQGGCHCGKVRYEVDLDLQAGSSQCNCSICHKTGAWGMNVDPSAFRLLAGEEDLSDYQFASRSGHHLFCKHCGVRSFGRFNVPQMGGPKVSINLRCLEGADLDGIPIRYFNGKENDWSAAMRPPVTAPAFTLT